MTRYRVQLVPVCACGHATDAHGSEPCGSFECVFCSGAGLDCDEFREVGKRMRFERLGPLARLLDWLGVLAC